MLRYLVIILSLFSQDIFANEQKFYQSGELKIAYREFGAGKALFVLNGGPGRSSDSFIPLANELTKKNFKVFLFDQRGTGQSKAELSDKNITIDLMVEDLENLRKHLKLEKISILGHSFGGMYGMSYAAKYPDQVEKLILSSSGGIDLVWKKYVGASLRSRISPEAKKKLAYWEKIEEEKRKKKQDITEANHQIGRLLAPAYVYDPKFIPEIAKSLSNPKVSVPAVNNLVWKSMEKYDLKGSFKNFKSPTLILAGRQDFLGDEVPLTIHQNIPSSKLIFINECSHYPWLDQPTEYFKAISEFMN